LGAPTEPAEFAIALGGVDHLKLSMTHAHAETGSF
jgi:hypothetical protein